VGSAVLRYHRAIDDVPTTLGDHDRAVDRKSALEREKHLRPRGTCRPFVRVRPCLDTTHTPWVTARRARGRPCISTSIHHQCSIRLCRSTRNFGPEFLAPSDKPLLRSWEWRTFPAYIPDLCPFGFPGSGSLWPHPRNSVPPSHMTLTVTDLRTYPEAKRGMATLCLLRTASPPFQPPCGRQCKTVSSS
jgi:hypothetical protein